MSIKEYIVCSGCGRKRLTPRPRVNLDKVVLCDECNSVAIDDVELGVINSRIRPRQFSTEVSNGLTLGTLRNMKFEFRGITVSQALDAMTSGCCGD